MRIKAKITLGAAVLSIIPVLIASLAIGWLAIDSSHVALEETARDRLTALRDTKKEQIADYFQTIEDQILNLSVSNEVVEATEGFIESLSTLRGDYTNADVTKLREELASYYRSDFANTFKTRNSGDSVEVDTLLRGLDADAVVLQHQFIKANNYPLGEKDKLIDPQNGTKYGEMHRHFHPYFRDFQQRFGYYDIFIADAESGRIIYSVFKELDFATSLKTGAYANSGIGKVFQEASRASTSEAVAMSDFAPYLPSYQDNASFIATPIYRGNKKIAVLIFQMPIDRINAVMTMNGHWKDVGLGDSGETYLVGPDKLMRSVSRFLLEDKEGYFNALAAANTEQRTIDLIRVKDTSIGLQAIDTEGTRSALSGTSGFSIFPDYRGVEVLSSYAPIELGGKNWAIMAEIDKAEAFSAADSLASQLMMMAAGVSVVLIVLAVSGGFWFANSLSSPIQYLAETITEVENSSDLTHQVDMKRNDELGMAANAFNSMVAKFRDSLNRVSDMTHQLAATAEETSVITEQTNEAVQQQLNETTHVATAMTEMGSTVQEVAASANNTAHAVSKANDQAAEGQRTMQDTIAQIQRLASEVESAAEVIRQLEKHSEEIGSVLDVISNIAEQTNLLALNAAIEAARAGEQGRGFAVVADEVRNLASKTQVSTEEINQMIQKLQNGSGQAVSAMNQSQTVAGSAAEQAVKTGEALSVIAEAVTHINDMSTQIASAAEEQSAVVAEINQNIVQISDSTEQTATGANQTAEASGDLARLASDLQGLVGQFKV
ncbi:MAG: methyl-accepting chemotaxis protein [Chromatiales bacterium]|nr:methyl-accepting chemotaxis protein [Chromatiales bacterium]